MHLGGAGAADRPDPRRAGRPRGRPRGPRRRLHAERPRDGPRLPGGRVARRDLVLGGARVRRPQRHRPLRPDRAEGPARRRRLSLRRAATSTAPRSSTAIAAEIPGLEHTVRFGYLDGSGWEDGFLGPTDAELEFEGLPFDHPLWVLYSSGTTGLPKPIVHGHGGMLLEHLKKMHLHLDAQEGDRVFWFTTTGWMMWNFLVGVLLTDASIVLFDGNPGHPDLETLWQLADDAEITTFGTSASFIASCMKAGVEPAGVATSRSWRRSARPAPPSPPRASTGSTSSSDPRPGCSRPPAAPTSAPRSSAASPPCPSTRASCRPGRSGPTCTPSDPTERTSSARSASW